MGGGLWSTQGHYSILKQCELCILIEFDVDRILHIAVIYLASQILRLRNLRLDLILRPADRLRKPHRLHIQRANLLALRLQTLLSDELLSIHTLWIAVHVLASESDLELRMKIIAQLHKI